jgi:signal peptidase
VARSAAHAARVEPSPRRALSAALTVLIYLAGAAGAWFLWPTSLGGCTTLTIVSGHSMEPTLRTGDLVVARCGQAKVGDIVVYNPPGMPHSRIIHRVIGGDGAGWTMRGDNNAWNDPFTPTSGDVLGIARLRVPGIGLVGRFLVNPWIWVSVLVLAFALLVWPGRSTDDDADDAAPTADRTDDRGPAADGADDRAPAADGADDRAPAADGADDRAPAADAAPVAHAAPAAHVAPAAPVGVDPRPARTDVDLALAGAAVASPVDRPVAPAGDPPGR